MNNQKNLWTIRGIAISLMVALLATGSAALAGRGKRRGNKQNQIRVTAPPVTQESLNAWLRLLKSFNPNHRGRNGIVGTLAYEQLFGIKGLITQSPKTKIAGSNNVFAVAYCALHGKNYQAGNLVFTQVCAPANSNEIGHIGNLIKSLPEEILFEQTVVRAILYGGSPDAINALAKRLSQVQNNKHRPKFDIALDIAKICEGEILVQIEGTQNAVRLDNLSENLKTYREDLKRSLYALLDQTYISNKAMRDHLRGNQQPAPNSNISSGASDFLMILKVARKAEASNVCSAISHFLIKENIYRQLSDNEKFKVFLSACIGTNYTVICHFLTDAVTHIQTINDATNKLNAFNDLSAKLSRRYSIDPREPNKQRTLIHCILRHADGSNKKSVQLAPKEDTVRALLMLMVAGANPFSTRDQFVNQSNQVRQGVTAGQIPEKSYNYLTHTSVDNGPHQHHGSCGANFRFYDGYDIFGYYDDNNTWHPNTRLKNEQRNQLRTSLENLCFLYAFIMGDQRGNQANRLRMYGNQVSNIKRTVLSGVLGHNPVIAPLQPATINEYLGQLLTTLENIETLNIEQFLQTFNSTYTTAQGTVIWNNLINITVQ